MDFRMANQGGSSSVLRDYRKGNWTVQETLVLIEAKKMDEERRMKRNMGESSDQQMTRNKPAELRWKWVEDYCWRKGCFRSQNQCNDKWDNLMRDFKKVRDYERKILVDQGNDNTNIDNKNKSYWNIEKSERKEKNLPSNMLFGIYEALVQVVERKCFRVVGCGGLSTNMTTTTPTPTPQNIVLERVSTTRSVQVLPPPNIPIQQQIQHPPISSPLPITMLPLPPPQQQPPPQPQLQPQPQPQPQQQHYALPSSQPLPTVGRSDSSDASEYTDSPAKRRRRKSRGKRDHGTSSTTGNVSGTSLTDFGSAIYKSASIIAEALQAGEEREDVRHKDLLSLHERRLQIEQSKAEINRQGFNGLADAINNLSNSILTLATRRNNPNQ